MPEAPSPEWSRKIQDRLKVNFAEIQNRIEQACQRSGRSSKEVKLIAVTKYTPMEIVAELISLNRTDLGENRPQQLVERSQQLSGKFSWHLIGQLQRNKVRAVLPHVEMIHSVDSIRLLEQLDRIAAELQIRPSILLQVNISEEEAKSGFSVFQIKKNWETISKFESLNISGLMTMAPQTSDESTLRYSFGGLRELRDELNSQANLIQLNDLSMGMSSDFEIAIEEGATYIRLGSSLFAGCELEP